MTSYPLLCLACSSSLSSSGSNSHRALSSPSEKPDLRTPFQASPLPSHSEKADPPPHEHACGHVVCGRCIRVNRRLAQYCLLCGSVKDVLSGPVAEGSGSREVELPGYNERETGSTSFVIGDEDEEETEDVKVLPADGGDGASMATSNQDGPPAYELATTTSPDREQCSIHYIQPLETLRGIALHYGLDVRSIVSTSARVDSC